MRRAALAALALLASLLLVYQARPQPPLAATPAALADIHDINRLRAQFNQDEGQPRLILLLSPT